MPVTIIAEAGVNHNGDLETAKRMAYVAKECGADIVKYQTAVPELVVSRFAEKAEYQKQTTDAAESQLEMIRKLHFSFEGHRELKEYCDSIGIQYLSAPFDIPSVRFLGTLGMPLIKMPSGEIRLVPSACCATIGQVGNVDHSNVVIGNAGRNRQRGIRPTVRGSAMKAVDHPMGGGRGDGKGGNIPRSPWNQQTRGLKTRSTKKAFGWMIVSDRRKNKVK